MSPNAIITHVENTEKNLIFNDGNEAGGRGKLILTTGAGLTTQAFGNRQIKAKPMPNCKK